MFKKVTEDAILPTRGSKYSACVDRNINYRKSKKGIVAVIYATQRAHSKTRGHEMPNYSLEELRKWVYSQDNFDLLYNKWIESGCKTKLKPSIDRIDDTKPYLLKNIQLMTWNDNRAKGHIYQKIGKKFDNQKSVFQLDKNGNFIKEFISIREAERASKARNSDITAVCKGKRKTAGGFIWKYKGDTNV